MIALLLALAAQDAGPWIAGLGSDDIDQRAEARKRLLETGEKALPALRKALGEAADADLKARLREIMARVGRAQAPANVTVEVVLPKEPPTLAEAQGKDFKVTVRITNGNDFEVVLWPYFELEVRDKDGKESGLARRIYAGIRPNGCFLRVPEWLTIEAKKSADLSTSLAAYTLDFRAVSVGWKLPEPGGYALAFSTAYSREEFVARCKGCKERHDDPEGLWNRALDLKRTAKGTLNVVK